MLATSLAVELPSTFSYVVGVVRRRPRPRPRPRPRVFKKDRNRMCQRARECECGRGRAAQSLRLTAQRSRTGEYRCAWAAALSPRTLEQERRPHGRGRMLPCAVRAAVCVASAAPDCGGSRVRVRSDTCHASVRVSARLRVSARAGLCGR